MKSKVYKIIQIVLLAIMGLIILILGIYVIKKVSSGNKPVKMFGFSIYEVDISGSMYNPDDPESLLPGDLLFVKAQKEYFVGDVITYQLDETKSSVTHKIINIDGISQRKAIQIMNQLLNNDNYKERNEYKM